MPTHSRSKPIPSIINAPSLNGADVALLQAPYEATVSYGGGAHKGPAKILDAMNSKLELFDRALKCEPVDRLRITSVPPDDMSKMSPEEAYAYLTQQTRSVLREGVFPFLLGGEHSVSLGPLRALSEVHNPADVTIIQFDAHCDLRDSDADYSAHPSRFAHSCVMRRAHELGYHLVQVGIRTYAQAEYAYFTKHPETIRVFEWGRKISDIASIVSSISTQYVYITIDADGFDPAHMPATGTPVQGGIEWWYGIELLEQIMQNHTVIGADIVEVAPVPTSVLTEYGAAQLLYSIIAGVFASKLRT